MDAARCICTPYPPRYSLLILHDSYNWHYLCQDLQNHSTVITHALEFDIDYYRYSCYTVRIEEQTRADYMGFSSLKNSSQHSAPISAR